MSAHTPGPWEIERGEQVEIVTRSRELGGTVALVMARTGSKTGEADARLIAAVPEMLAALPSPRALAALVESLEEVEDQRNSGDGSVSLDAVDALTDAVIAAVNVARIRAAIAKVAKS